MPELEKRIRFDKLLTILCEDLSRSRVQQLINAGCVWLADDLVQDPSLQLKPKLHTGRILSLTIPPAVTSVFEPEDIPLEIHFEDEHLIILNKPAGLVVHPAPGHESGTLVNALLHHCGEGFLSVGGVERPGIVHRLDKDTSGLIVVAKNEQTLTALQKLFVDRTIKRAYQAVVAGLANPTSGEINQPIGRHPVDRKRMAVEPRNGKVAITGYKTERVFGNLASIVECRLQTGRTHQIRVHMNFIGNSLIGDPVYGPKRKSFYPAFDRQALHARELGFIHPVTNEEIFCTVEAPQDMQDLVSELASL